MERIGLSKSGAYTVDAGEEYLWIEENATCNSYE
jgi:hypothetical protein